MAQFLEVQMLQHTVESFFMVLLRPDFGLWGQHSALQALVNIMEKLQSLVILKLTPNMAPPSTAIVASLPQQQTQKVGVYGKNISYALWDPKSHAFSSSFM